MAVGYVFAIIGIAAVYLVLAVFVLPKLLFRARYSVAKPVDRGIKKVEGDEPALVFQPTTDVAEHVSRYAIVERDGKRVLVCKLAHNIDYIDYDVVVFSDDAKAENAFNIKDGVRGTEYTKPVELPGNTECVSLIINEVDGKKYKNGVFKNVAAWRVAVFLLCTAVLTFAAVFGIKTCLAYMAAGIFGESFIFKGESIAVTCIIAGIIVLFDVVLTVVAFIARITPRGKR